MNAKTRALVFAGFLLLSAVAIAAGVNSTLVLVPLILISFPLIFQKSLKNVKIFLWFFFVLLSVSLLGINLAAGGLEVVSAGNLVNVVPGDVILAVNDVPATSFLLAQNFSGTVKFTTRSGVKFENVNGTLTLEAVPVSATNLEFGLDLRGGVRAVLQPNETDNSTIDDIISTLQTRINVYGLRESVFRPVNYEGQSFVEISIAGGDIAELRSLLENQGKFEARIGFDAVVSNMSGSFDLDREYGFVVLNNSVEVDSIPVRPGDTIELSGVPLTLDSISARSIKFNATVFTGEDVVTVFFDPQRSRIESAGGAYRWTFGVQLSQAGAQKFAWVTDNLGIVAGQGHLSSLIEFYLDENLVDALTIASSLRGRAETEISISGSSDTRDLAVRDRAQLQTILRSGALPTSVEIVQLETISPTLGSGFLGSAMVAGLAAMLGVVVVIGIRYRNPRLVVPMIVVSLSEVLIILGVASLIKWTIDLPAIAGIVAAVGTGVDSQIMIIDQALRGEEITQTLREKMKRAFFVIFGAGGTVIAAMLPLMAIGFGALRGFAIITIIGVLVGILVTRPAFGVVIQKILEK